MTFDLLQTMKSIAALFLSLVCSVACQRDAYVQLTQPSFSYPLPDLPYGYNELEPVIDTHTLQVHHQGHHKAYANKMNAALKQWKEEEPDSELAQSSIISILQNISSVPKKWQTALRNNGGGYVNHIFYWVTMCPRGHRQDLPTGKLMEAIIDTFITFDKFKVQFSQAAATLFGSGYVWLCEDKKGDLHIITTYNQDSPLSDGLYPLLVLDVWEHAYYLKHQNKRVEYIKDWWEVVCWEHVNDLKVFWMKGSPQSKHSEL